MSREAMQQALEALEQFIEKELTVGQRYTNEGSRLLEAIAALRAALAEQVQPVAWMCTETKVLYDHDTSEVDKYHGFKPTVPLYIAAPAPVAPPGWRMVPVEPTGEMWSEGKSAFSRIRYRMLDAKTSERAFAHEDTAPHEVWAAMLAAAPEAPTQPAPHPVFCECGDEIVPDDGARCGTCVATKTPKPLTERELELLDGMIEVQLRNAAQCDLMLARAGGNHTMAVRQKGLDMERVELLRKIRGMGEQR